MAVRSGPVAVSSTAFFAVGCLLHIIGMATPYWTVSTVDDSHAGLFEICVRSVCLSYTSVFGSLRIARDLAIVGIVMAGVTLLLSGLLLRHIRGPFVRPAVRRYGFYVGTKGIIAGAVILAGAIVFATNLDDSVNYYLGYSLYLSIFGGSTMISGGSLAYVAGYRAFNELQQAPVVIAQGPGFGNSGGFAYQSQTSGVIYGQPYQPTQAMGSVTTAQYAQQQHYSAPPLEQQYGGFATPPPPYQEK